ncbi:cardiolipin synthase [Luteolibacter sp. SL250]|uniref:cardiolipin synthase n=1 Tax=Luteolibacter sp. SL250 TaxID=2995170 RepID=UPI00226F9E0A|nr:cardiolipin synthase [Luteolibacter sp. SL250]WAC19918.1 cardiolipin synthase [Luteolibacter sp. SL250]
MALISPEVMAWLGIAGVATLHVLGLVHVIHAVMHVRTSQGTIAWVISLLTFPYVAIPLYWLLGRTRFEGYVRARRNDDSRMSRLAASIYDKLAIREVEIPRDDAFARTARYLGGLPFTRGNSLKLLIDGEETFEAIFSAIRAAERYVCVNFYIVKSDRIGIKFQQLLIEKARQGVDVWFLFDEIGSSKLPRRYLRELKEAGVHCESFGTNRMWYSRLQLNFRNHRKIVVIDGELGFIGGINVGDEYLGRAQKFGKWRDTHLMMRGPTVEALQLVFLQDWHWATDHFLDLTWEKEVEDDDQIAAIIPTGPADELDSWQLMVAEAANSSRERLWIASPYFVPDEGVMTALQAAAIRGVDVRIMIPKRADHLLVWLSAFTYYEQSIPFGVKIFRYQTGFLHQKVMLIDERLAAVGSANLDNRSFRLNFEIMAFSSDKKFIREVTEMLEQDFRNCAEETVEDFTRRPFHFRVGARLAKLLAPVQ